MSKVIEAEPKGPKPRPNVALQTTNPADVTGVRLIEQAFADYVLQLRDIWAAAQKRSEEAYAKYLSEVEEIYRAAFKRFEELYRSYLSAVEKMSAEDPQSVAEAEYNELVRKAKEVWTPADNTRLFEAYSRYVNEWREAWSTENSRGRFEEAYRGYLAAVQKGWGAVDINAVSASNLGAIGESIRTAAGWGGSTLR